MSALFFHRRCTGSGARKKPQWFNVECGVYPKGVSETRLRITRQSIDHRKFEGSYRASQPIFLLTFVKVRECRLHHGQALSQSRVYFLTIQVIATAHGHFPAAASTGASCAFIQQSDENHGIKHLAVRKNIGSDHPYQAPIPPSPQFQAWVGTDATG